MSRVERYKEIHKQAKPEKAPQIRKTIKRPNTEHAYQEDQVPLQDAPEYPDYDNREPRGPGGGNGGGGQQPPQPPKKKKTPKPKKRRKKSWLRRILLVLLLLLALAVGMFYKGHLTAKNDKELVPETEETFNGFKNTDGSSNILILGSDSRGEDAGRADTIMVLQLDGKTKKAKLISFMRDSFVDIPDVGMNKINSAYAYGGADLVRRTLKQNFGIECRYYVKVDFQSFEKVIDTMFPGGVQIDAEKDMSKNIDADIKKGEQKMDGHTLLQYARFRMDEEGDFGRVRRQQQVMNAVLSQMKNPLNLIHLPEGAGTLMGYLSTDVPTSYMVKNSVGTLLKAANGIDRLTVPVKDSWAYGTSDYAGSVLELDMAMNQQAITKFLSE